MIKSQSCFWRQRVGKKITIIPQVDTQKVAATPPCPMVRLPQTSAACPRNEETDVPLYPRGRCSWPTTPKIDEINANAKIYWGSSYEPVRSSPVESIGFPLMPARTSSPPFRHVLWRPRRRTQRHFSGRVGKAFAPGHWGGNLVWEIMIYEGKRAQVSGQFQSYLQKFPVIMNNRIKTQWPK